jgi:hypothetical protein
MPRRFANAENGDLTPPLINPSLKVGLRIRPNSVSDFDVGLMGDSSQLEGAGAKTTAARRSTATALWWSNSIRIRQNPNRGMLTNPLALPASRILPYAQPVGCPQNLQPSRKGPRNRPLSPLFTD